MEGSGGLPGENIRRLRDALGLSLRDVEKLTEGQLRSGHLSQIETGQVRNPSLSVLRELAKAFGMKMPDLVAIIEPEEQDPSEATQLRAAALFRNIPLSQQAAALEFLTYLARRDDPPQEGPDARGG